MTEVPSSTKKNKKIKTALICLIVFSSVLLTYFAFGVVSLSIIDKQMFKTRYSTPELINDSYYRWQKSRKDFANLNEREVVTFPNNKETLQGYLYKVENPHGIIIAAHGVNSLADGNCSQLHSYFIDKGWDVFSFDLTGCGGSTGSGITTLYESRNCVVSAINYIKSNETTRDLPICLVGHSWGGYGSVAATYDYDVNAVAAFSAYNTPNEIMLAFGMEYGSPAVILTKPLLDTLLPLYHGNNVYFSASKAIKKKKETKYVIVHGTNDEVVPFKQYSLYSSIENKNYDNVTLYKLDGFVHNGPWRSKEAVDYEVNVVEPEVKRLEKEGTSSDVNTYINSVDKEKTSELNYEMLDSINNIFLNTI